MACGKDLCALSKESEPESLNLVDKHLPLQFNILERVANLKVTLYGSLAATGRGVLNHSFREPR